MNISEIFLSIQGESSQAGFPTVFIRTAGCNLECSYCDTEYARSSGEELSLEKILKPKGINFIHEEATGVDADSSKVITKSQEIPYDYLMIATGPALGFSTVPGFGPEGGYTECIFELDQALQAKKAWDKFHLPYPFTKGAAVFGDPICVPEDADPNKYIKIVNQSIHKANRRASDLLIE